MRFHRLRLPAAVVAAVLVAEAAVWLLRPDGVIDPLPVSESAYFSAAQLDRVHDFRDLQRLIGIGGLVAEGALLVLLVARPPRGAIAWGKRLGRDRPLVGAALVGAGVILAVQLVALPFGAWAHERAADVGLSTQDWGAWMSDRAKAAAVAGVLAAGGAALFSVLMRRFPRRWWLAGAGAVVAIEIVFVWLAPVVVDPLFNRYEDLPQGRTRAAVTQLAERAGVDVGDVLVVDASRRTTAANAYVNGLGHTKRVVLYDNLLDDFSRDETRLVVAHALGHVRYHDVPRGLIWLAIVTPFGLFAASRMTLRLAPQEERPGPAVLPALALSVAVIVFLITTVSNQLSRRVEARADSFSLQLTDEPDAFISFQRRIALKNVSDPDPWNWTSFLFGTHPTTVDRIGTGVAVREGR
jgi:STE24 endopeptidase